MKPSRNNLLPLLMTAMIPPPPPPIIPQALPAFTVIPKGCREYWFNAAGEAHWMEGYDYKPCRILLSDVVFKCVASNEKNAIRKFKNRKA